MRLKNSNRRADWTSKRRKMIWKRRVVVASRLMVTMVDVGVGR
jgi:hypothetical protein